MLVGTSDVESSSCIVNPSDAVGYTVTSAVGRCITSSSSWTPHEFSATVQAVKPMAKMVLSVILISFTLYKLSFISPKSECRQNLA